MARVAGALEIQMFAGITRLQKDMNEAKTVVGTSMKSIDASVASTKQSFDRLATALKAAIGIYGVRELISLSDQFTLLSGKIKNATESQSQFNQMMADSKRIGAIAQADLGAIAQFFSRLSLNTRDLGVSQKELATVVEATTLALKVNGASVSETTSALQQLSQAFGKGRLDGDEFRTVMEAAPGLMRRVAESMGVPFGALKDLGAQGKITGAELVKAFTDKKYLDGLREQMKEMMTISGAFTILKNNMMEYVGINAQASGSVATIIGLINVLAENLKLLAGVILTIVASKFAQWLASSVAALYASVSANRAAALAALATAEANAAATASEVALTAARMAEMRATLAVVSQDVQLAITLNGLIPMQARATAAATAHAASLAGLATAQRAASVTATAASGALALLGGPIGAITLALGLGATAWAVWGNAAKNAGDEAKTAIANALLIARQYEKEAKFGAGNVGALRAGIEAIEKRISLLGQTQGAGAAALLLEARNQAAALKAALVVAEGLKPPAKPGTPVVVDEAAMKKAAAEAKKFADKVEADRIASLEARMEKEQETARQLGQFKLAQINKAKEDAKRAAEDMANSAKQVFDATRTPSEQFTKQIQHLNDLLRAGAIDFETYERAGGKAMDKLVADTKTTTDEMTEFWKSAAQNMQSSMSNFFFDIMQGNLSDLAGNFKRTIDRMVADMLAAKAATALFGDDFGKGGSIGGLIGKGLGFLGGSGGSAPAWGGPMAAGGDFMVNRPTLFLAGEAGPERATFSGAGNADKNDSRIKVNNVFHISGATDTRSQMQIAAAAGQGVQRALARNT